MALGGASLACAPAAAQMDATEIEGRIAAAFALVEGNPLDLAVPLARLALARRSAEREAARAAEDTGPIEAAVAGGPEFSAVVVSADVEQGSADGSEAADIARLPRPRPAAPGEEASAPLIGQPLDLVAGAVAANTVQPQPLLVAAVDSGETALSQPPAPLATELVAGGSCVPASEIADRDGDFSRNAELLSGSGFCVADTEFEERDKTWVIQTIATSRPGPLWAVLHDDEDLSFDNAVKALNAYGGTLITVDTGGKRLLEGIDPNRNFSAGDIGCSKLGDDATPRYTMVFRGLFDPAQPIIALHNNESRQPSTGGYGHASMEAVGKGMRAFPASDQGPLAGEDTLVLVAVTDEDDAAAATTEALHGHGINVLLEIVREDRGDCSLSNYALLSGHKGYFNVTVGEDEGEKQMKIIDAVMSGRAGAVATE